jgi:RecB family endonuclease NucS
MLRACQLIVRSGRYHPVIKPGSGHDPFFKLGQDQYRLWNWDTDGQPPYNAEIEKVEPSAAEEVEEVSDEAGSEFAYEHDLQSYLAKNLHRIEPGLRLYDEEEISSLEFPAGDRYIDILAVDAQGNFVVIELKVSRGYDRVIGQLLRYLA